MNNQKIVIGNWKMKPKSLNEAKSIFKEVVSLVSRIRGIEVVVAPPTIFFGDIINSYSGKKISFAVQDSFWESEGSFTGQTSPYQAREAGASYTILGHSEMRALGEKSVEVSKKALAAIEVGLKPIICVGEEKRDMHGEYLSFIEKEVQDSVSNIPEGKIEEVIIAYEPIWAIGKSAQDAIDSSELHAMKILIRKILSRIYGKKKAFKVPIVYGGSTEPGNVEELASSEVSGFLVGHESLEPKDFAEIIKKFSKNK